MGGAKHKKGGDLGLDILSLCGLLYKTDFGVVSVSGSSFGVGGQ